MIVRIVRDWGYPADFLKQTPGGKGLWGDIVFTEDKTEKCDLLVVLQRPPYDIEVTCPKDNKWLITQESPDPWFDFYKKSFKYFDKVFTVFQDKKFNHLINHHPLLPWHVNRSYDELSRLSIADLSNKTDSISWITSNRKGRVGHKARMKFKDFLEQKEFKFDLMGAGFVHIEDKFDGLFPYKYSIAVENYFCDNYWTEKIADCYLSWTMPIYCGSTNILDYFPEESMIIIDVNKPEEALRIIHDAIKNSRWEKNLKYIEEARNLILNKYQFFPQISEMVKTYQAENNKEYVQVKIPKNEFPWQQVYKNHWKYYSKAILKRMKSFFSMS